MRLPVAIQFYSVRDEAEKDFRGTLQKIHDMGYEGVEFAGLFGHSPAEVRAMCDEIGIIPMSAHVALDEMLADPDKVIGGYAEIGCRFIAVPYVTEERRPGAEKFDETIEDIRRLGDICNKHGVTLLYHNHDFEFVMLDGKRGLDVLYERVEPELLETEIDVCWARVGGEDPAKYVLKYSGRAPVVHLKDYAGKPEGKLYNLIGIDDNAENDSGAFTFKPVGHGVQNIPAILDAAVVAGAEWVVVEQDSPDEGNTSLNAAKMSIDYLKTVNK